MAPTVDRCWGQFLLHEERRVGPHLGAENRADASLALFQMRSFFQSRATGLFRHSWPASKLWLRPSSDPPMGTPLWSATACAPLAGPPWKFPHNEWAATLLFRSSSNRATEISAAAGRMSSAGPVEVFAWDEGMSSASRQITMSVRTRVRVHGCRATNIHPQRMKRVLQSNPMQ